MLIEKIRAATSEHHQSLETALFPFINTIRTNDDYARLLTTFYGYISPVQELVAKYVDRTLVTDMEERRNASLLLDDLKTIGVTSMPATATALPLIAGSAAALGALFVLEGPTLGGKMISKMIGERLQTEKGITFFKGYGPDTGKMWKNFTQYLQDASLAGDAEMIAATASETFRLFGIWIEKSMQADKTNPKI